MKITQFALSVLLLAGSTSLYSQTQTVDELRSTKIGTGDKTFVPQHALDIKHDAGVPNINTQQAFRLTENLYTNTSNTSPLQINYKLFEVKQNLIYDNYPNPSGNPQYTLNTDVFVIESFFPGGRVGIDGDISFEPNPHTHRHIRGMSNQHGLAIYGDNGWANGSGILLNGSTNTGNNPGGIDFVSCPSAQPWHSAFSFWLTDASGAWITRLMQLTKDGQAIIGNAPAVSSNDYKLYVETGILTEKVKVATIGSTSWADYVFDKDYDLQSLNEVEKFIRKNHHLPNVPSAKEVEENGFDLAEMDATLLRKIEELTLYVLQQQKEIEGLKKELSK